MHLRSFFTALIFTSLSSHALAAHKPEVEPAWNGHTPPGAATPAPFTPYYVPPGAKSYDSASPLVHYKGSWTDAYAARFVGGSLRKTTKHGAAVSFTFTGTGIEWFGCTGPRYGSADVYIDGKHAQRVDAYTAQDHVQQRLFWSFNLPHKKHTIKIIHSGKKRKHGKTTTIDLDAFVVTKGTPSQSVPALPQVPSRPSVQNSVQKAPTTAAQGATPPSSGGWELVQKGTTGVNAMQLAIISPSHALIMDKVEHNPLTTDKKRPAWGALYNLETHTLTPLHVKSNSFCAGGTFLGNGTLVNVGGNPVVEDHTAAADFGDAGGMQAIRLFAPCEVADAAGCDILEDPARIRLASPRWYNTALRIQDGSAMILGGSTRGGWMNNVTTNNPTVEYFPPKSIQGANGTPVRMQFLVDTLNSNLFPIAFALPDGRVFVAANRDAMLYDWQTNTEQRLPQIPNGVRVTYPMTGTAVLLPLVPENNYAPEVLICGGSTLEDTQPSWALSARDPASDQCARLLLTPAGIETGWQVERMPNPRTMPDAVLLPTGAVVLVNGAGSGISGYGNVKDQVGQSNADAPVLAPVLYDPGVPAGNRFTQGLPESTIPRMYHSTATLTPNGDIMIAGSNPNLDRSEMAYGTEYRVEWLRPSYMTTERPTLNGAPRMLGFGEKVQVQVTIPQGLRGKHTLTLGTVSLMDLGYVTHAVHANSRLVYLVSELGDDGRTLAITGPPNGGIYPPGPGWLYVVAGDVPSTGLKIMVGDGQGPPVDHDAIRNMLESTKLADGSATSKTDGSE
ncbi:glyoxal oxidase N-terminus-domain-containing protein [Gloeopeniophorella convolvens]|nr:glyoxal oxidase N-terminus-domain-containing protein [Gloeopeniophorella convolvens]